MRIAYVAVVVVACSAGGVALAGELAPGEVGRVIDDPKFPVFTPIPGYGDLLAERSEPFEFTHVTDPEDGAETWFSRGTFTTRVYRRYDEPEHLAFFYELVEAQTNAVNDLEAVFLRGFRGLLTDVYAFDDFEDEFGVRRSADGDTIQFGFNLEHINGSFLVRTNATEFALRPDAFTVEMDFAYTGDNSMTFNAFAPVPEPSNGAYLIAAGAAFLCRTRRLRG